MLYADDIIMFFLIGIVALAIPLTLTILNLYNLCSQKPKAVNVIALMTLIVGGSDYVLLLVLQFDPSGEWYEAIEYTKLHSLISGAYEISIDIPLLIGVVGLISMLVCKPEKLSPIVSSSAIAGIIILNIINIAFAIQISNQVLEKNASFLNLLFYVYHFNILVISSIVIKKQVQYQLKYYENLSPSFSKNKVADFLYSRIDSIYKYSGVIFIFLFGLIALMEIIFVLIGQGVDGPIKAFTDTADWTFSQQIPPPPIEYQGHYLCTVAAGGHRKVVKPLRYGVRRGQKIIVNRQLCIANAFEDYIQEKFPRFHKLIRGLYDKYGYPISNHITSPERADIVYYLMKPLEWFFVAFLYMMDVNPEERIRNQYSNNASSQ